MSRVVASFVTLLAVLVAAFSILVVAWSFSYPGRLYACTYALEQAGFEDEYEYCFKRVEVNL